MWLISFTPKILSFRLIFVKNKYAFMLGRSKGVWKLKGSCVPCLQSKMYRPPCPPMELKTLPMTWYGNNTHSVLFMFVSEVEEGTFSLVPYWFYILFLCTNFKILTVHFFYKSRKTRMHSSRMCATRSSTPVDRQILLKTLPSLNFVCRR